MLSYHELRQESPELARKMVRKVLRAQEGNVSETSRILGIDRKTVRRSRDGQLPDNSKKPLRSQNKTPVFLENTILTAAKDTGYRYRRLHNYLWNLLKVDIPEDTIKGILKRNDVKKKRVRTVNKRRRPLYDYEHLAPFAEMQLDTKHILDQNALPKNVYQHIQNQRLPLYEWNLIDMATRTRFTAYSHELSALYGKMFMTFVLLWLRTHGIDTHIHIQADNGPEFCLGSKKKEERLNLHLKTMNASFTSIPAGKKYLQGVIERSHRSDDEEFLAIHPLQCHNSREFIAKAQRWQDTWNAARQHFGIAMNGDTPLQKLIQKHVTNPQAILKFPVFHLQQLLPHSHILGGEYLLTNYLLIIRETNP